MGACSGIDETLKKQQFSAVVWLYRRSSPTSGAIFYPIRQDSVIFAAELLPKL